MLEIVTGHFRAQAVCVAAKLGIADLLKEGRKRADELSRATGANRDALYRLLRALASLGIFAEDPDGLFQLTPLAETLRSDSPNSIRGAALLGAESFHWNSWTNLTHSIMTGESAFEHVHGMEMFQYLSRHPEEAAIYNNWMSRRSDTQIPAIVSSYEFSRFSTVLDVGGGHGALLAAILGANPGVSGILFDLPALAGAGRLLHGPGVNERCRIVEGDMFESVPSGADLYVLKTVIHDWNDDLSLRVLKNCRKAMASGARLLLIESVVPAGNMPHFSKFMDLNMLVLTHGGRERTESEYRVLFHAAGFELTRVIETPAQMSLLEGCPITSPILS
jgi:SAM-dependent methyltransferase